MASEAAARCNPAKFQTLVILPVLSLLIASIDLCRVPFCACCPGMGSYTESVTHGYTGLRLRSSGPQIPRSASPKYQVATGKRPCPQPVQPVIRLYLFRLFIMVVEVEEP